eukprot:CAMPEP_0116995218 /NCGR_PEP_ID=MMETSP0467-20121206/68617_1 /TAXON_ID=283647 /ORGANISM="Mesodinium pulex, Strain SPMC105" /LENGTH=145 /DNA_ID=CAMNT_0004693479 /DNA_START=40 /DNA_END=475 /DNA_ORIENTATION=-
MKLFHCDIGITPAGKKYISNTRGASTFVQDDINLLHFTNTAAELSNISTYDVRLQISKFYEVPETPDCADAPLPNLSNTERVAPAFPILADICFFIPGLRMTTSEEAFTLPDPFFSDERKTVLEPCLFPLPPVPPLPPFLGPRSG